MSNRLLAVVSLLVIFSNPSVVSAQNYVVTDLGTLGGSFSTGFGINDAGDVVGASYTAGNSRYHAFVYRAGVMKDLGTVTGEGVSEAWGINGRGRAAGATNRPEHGFRYQAYLIGTFEKAFKNLGTLGGVSSAAWDINHSDQATGAADGPGNSSYHAFFYSGAGSLMDLGTLGGTSSIGLGINNVGRIVGGANTAGDLEYHAFLWANGGMIDLGTLGGTVSEAWDINDNGRAVGYSFLSGDQAYRAFRKDGLGPMMSLGTLGGQNSAAFGVNNQGRIVGGSSTAGESAYHAFLFSDGQMIDINPPGWTETEARAINSSGQIVGRGYNPQGFFHAFLLTPSTNAAPTSAAVAPNSVARQPYTPTLMEQRAAIKRPVTR